MTTRGLLQPDAREEFVERLRPPTGYRLAHAVATTYSLDFVALTAMLLGLLGEDPTEEEALEPEALLQVLLLASERVRVFVDRGQVQALKHKRHQRAAKLVGLLDRVIHEVRLPQGRFHPKVWAIKYEPVTSGATGKGTGPVYRVICSSRNITRSTTLEVATWLDSSPAATAGRVGPSVAAFFGAVMDAAFGRGRPGRSSWERQLLGGLRAAKIPATPLPGMGEVSFLWQWPGLARAHDGPRPLLDHVGTGREALLVAPFLNKGFLEDLKRRFKSTHVVGRPDEIDRCWDQAWPATEVRSWVVRGATQGGADSTTENDVPATRPEPTSLHAKILAVDRGEQGRAVFIGSANGTRSAWRAGADGFGNVEAVFHLMQGPTPAAMRKRWKEDRFLEGYSAGESNGEKEETDGAHVEAWIRRLAGLKFIVRRAAGNGGGLVVVCSDPGALQAALAGSPADADIQVRLATNTEGVPAPLEALARDGLGLGEVAPADATEFLAFRVQVGEAWREVLLKAEWVDQGLPGLTTRREAVLAAAREDLDALLRRLLNAGPWRVRPARPDGRTETPPTPPTDATKPLQRQAAPAFLPSFEVVLERCVADPGLRRTVDEVLRVAGEGVFTETFHAFWGNLRAALRKAGC